MDSKITSEKLAKQLASIRDKKVKRLKTQISSGKYQVNNFSLAKALFFAR